MPWHWYLSSALPRALLAAFPLSVLGCTLERRVRPYMAVIVLFVALYSCLGHKEVRYMQCVLTAGCLLWRPNTSFCLCHFTSICCSVSCACVHTDGWQAGNDCCTFRCIVCRKFRPSQTGLVAMMQLRFLLPVLPMFNVAGACGLARIWSSRQKSWQQQCLAQAGVAALCASALASVLFSRASSLNYPGTSQRPPGLSHQR
jgi:Alg9-like mannosyltransferase family